MTMSMEAFRGAGSRCSWGSTMQGTTRVDRPWRMARMGVARYSQTAVTTSGRVSPWPTTGTAARGLAGVMGMVRTRMPSR